MKIEKRDPQLLAPHPVLKNIPPMTAEEMKSIRAGLARSGELMPPLLIDGEGRLLDDTSRTFWLCAKARQLKEVLVRVSDGDVHLLIVKDLAHRRHFTKSAIAYLAAPLLNQAFAAAKEKRLKNLANLDSALSALSGAAEPKTVDDLAEELGICRRTLFEARKVNELFCDKKQYTFNVSGGAGDGEVAECTLKEWFEPRILRAPIGGEHEQNRPLGLGAVIAGIASVREDRREMFSPKNANQMELFDSGLNALVGRAIKISAGQMEERIEAWLEAHKEKLSDTDLDRLEALGTAIKTTVREMRKSN